MKADANQLVAPPLGLYVHLPWCVRKCPYCDFNSHALREGLPAERYLPAVLDDLAADAPLVGQRSVEHIYIGGGTPSLFSAPQIEALLKGVAERVSVLPGAEITLEANPGTIERDSFTAYREAGITRVSLGAQSFDAGCLERIGRIHGVADIETSIASLHRSGIKTFNLDLMYALPGQDIEGALEDVRRAIAAGAPHISHYQLTLEPNTAFAASPPPLPDDEAAWDMMDQVSALLSDAGYRQYEISAWARSGQQCRHNLNYWRYGDYLGVGAGAHGKITDAAGGRIRRLAKSRGPERFMAGERIADERDIAGPERLFEYFLNTLRLRESIMAGRFEERTGLAWNEALARAQPALRQGLLEERDGALAHTETGWRFVNDIQALFLP
ncbi:MAG: radical SAM family heme chaperone HemW [Xanthomonadales bacterium]|nr:radical SAM family heme chaperone HemW [Xanthomonadales bacterium]